MACYVIQGKGWKSTSWGEAGDFPASDSLQAKALILRCISEKPNKTHSFCRVTAGGAGLPLGDGAPRHRSEQLQGFFLWPSRPTPRASCPLSGSVAHTPAGQTASTSPACCPGQSLPLPSSVASGSAPGHARHVLSFIKHLDGSLPACQLCK